MATTPACVSSARAASAARIMTDIIDIFSGDEDAGELRRDIAPVSRPDETQFPRFSVTWAFVGHFITIVSTFSDFRACIEELPPPGRVYTCTGGLDRWSSHRDNGKGFDELQIR
jgi:hypothetical protein